jgi:hypothetical protein
LPPGQHDTEPGGDALVHADGMTWRQSDDTVLEPRRPVWWRRDAIRTTLRSVTDEFEAAPTIDLLSRAPPGGYATDRRAAQRRDGGSMTEPDLNNA